MHYPAWAAVYMSDDLSACDHLVCFPLCFRITLWILIFKGNAALMLVCTCHPILGLLVTLWQMKEKNSQQITVVLLLVI